MSLLLLFACHPPDPSTGHSDAHDTSADTSVDTSTDTSTDTSADTSGDTSTARPTLLQPALATDLDPGALLDVVFTARPALLSVAGVEYEGFAYEGQVPGPTLRAPVGTELRLRLDNALHVETTLHWHGIAAPAAMDGVAWITDPVAPGDTFTYTLRLDRPGLYWYHPHVDVDHQVDLGLYGAILVEDPAEPAFDHDLVLVFDAWGETTAEDDHGLYRPESLVWTVNGQVDPVLTVAPGERVRARMVNASNTAYLDLRGAPLRRIAGDQGLLATPEELDRLVLAPGDRAELEWLVGDEAFDVTTAPYVPAGGEAWGEDQRLLTVAVQGSSAPAPEPAVFPWTNAAPSPDPTWTDLTYVFSGGTGGEQWLINGEAWPEVTTEVAPLGRETILEVRNLSATEHPFHLHGNAFEVLSTDGVPPAVHTVEDTVNVPIRSTLRLRLLPDNPGDWALHCHLLGHEEGGMMTILRVE